MQQNNVTVVSNYAIAKNVVRLDLRVEGKLPSITPGQFLTLSTGRGEQLLKRPFGIAAYGDQTVSVCFQIVGEGTKTLAKAPVGTQLEAVLPLGNGFPSGYKKVALIGGGVGVFPLMSFAKTHGVEFRSFLGFRSKEYVCCEKEFQAFGALSVCTDDGSYGAKGNAVDLFFESGFKPDAIFACGPLPMFRALKARCEGSDIPCYVSCEERMGCGVGACLVCTCDTLLGGKKRVCKDGPVFRVEELVL